MPNSTKNTKPKRLSADGVPVRAAVPTLVEAPTEVMAWATDERVLKMKTEVQGIDAHRI